jgi:hypothetical protein
MEAGMRQTAGMHGAFTYVIWIVVGVGVVVAILAAASSGKVWEQIGRDGMVHDRDRSSGGNPGTGLGDSAAGRAGPAPGDGVSAAGLAERDLEVRQMLQARNERRARRGEAPLDVESELRRLTAPARHPAPAPDRDAALAPDAPAHAREGAGVDEGVREEIRQLVVARNHRRARRGEPPLDVESEVQRRVAELSASYSRPTSS